MSLGKASAKGDFDKVTQLIKEGRNIEKQAKYSHRKWKVTDKPVRKCTPLIIASSEGHLDIARQLISAGANVHAKDGCSGSRKTALHYASEHGHRGVVLILLNNGSRSNEPDDCTMHTPLMRAIISGHEDIALELISRLHGDDFGVKDGEGHSALYYAHRKTFSKCTELLLSKMAQGDGGDREVSDARTWLEDYKEKALCRACKEGNLDEVKLLIKNGYNIEEQVEYVHHRDTLSKCTSTDTLSKCTPLIVASSEGHVDIVRELLRAGADIHNKDSVLGRTALHYACNSGHILVVQLLLDRGSPLNEPDDYDNHTPLILAVYFGHEEVASELLQRGADIHVKSKKNGRTALHIACLKGHLKCAQVLLDAGSRLNEPDDCDNWTPLIIAAYFGHEVFASELLQRGADIHVKSKEHGRTALYIACEKGHLKCVQVLLDAGSRLNEPDDCDNWTPLILAAYFGHEVFASELLQRGADIHVKSKEHGRTALHIACAEGHLKCAQVLLDAGSTLNEPDDYDNQTPLILAAYFGHEEVASELLQRGADIHVKSKKLRRTALHIACAEGHLKCVQLLLDAGSRLNEPDNYGNTPLHLSVKQSQVVQWLIERGCNVLVKNKEGLTAMDLVDIDILPWSSFNESTLPQVGLLAEAGCKRTILGDLQRTIQDSSLSPKMVVCVIGNTQSGKSTLIAALRNEGTSIIGKILKRYQKVDNITERTAGIEPISFKSQKYGEVMFYDFAGQHEYHGPHQTFLETLIKRPGTTLTVLLLVKATEKEEVILQQLTRWLQPLSWIISSESSIRVTVVGSFADQVKDLQEAKQKIERCCQSLQLLKRDILNIQYIIFTDSVLLDCRWIHSDGIEKICRLINQSPPPANLHLLSENKPYNVHYVLHHLRWVKPLVLSINRFSDWLQLRKMHIHLTKEEVFMLCKDLSFTGHVLLIENKQDLRKSWLVLQLDQILHRMYGALFTKVAPETSNKFGLVHVDQITKLLQEFEQDLIVSLLTSMDFCHEVDPLLFQSGILPPDQVEGWLFFPCLVTAKPTTYLPQEDSSSEYKYLCWQVNTAKTKFFSPRLLQTILLHLTTHQTIFKRGKPSRPEEVSLQVKEHCCILWWNGITWQTISGVDIVVQLFDNTIAQVIARISHEVDPPVLVNSLSSVTADILKTVNQLYPDLMPHLEAYIIDSTDYMELCTNPRCPNLHKKFLVSDITNILSSPEKENRFCLSLANESELPRKRLIKDLFCGCIPSLDNVLQLNPHKVEYRVRSLQNPLINSLSTKPSISLEDKLPINGDSVNNQDGKTSSSLRSDSHRPCGQPLSQKLKKCKFL